MFAKKGLPPSAHSPGRKSRLGKQHPSGILNAHTVAIRIDLAISVCLNAQISAVIKANDIKFCMQMPLNRTHMMFN